jgi:hypothetical protein
MRAGSLAAQATFLEGAACTQSGLFERRRSK